jgi:hypothetical protein
LRGGPIEIEIFCELMADGVVQVVECLLRKCEILSSSPSARKKKKEEIFWELENKKQSWFREHG